MADVGARFWARVECGEPDACWPWRGSRGVDGYGRLYLAGQCDRAHRCAWALTNGTIPDGMLICHRCDNPPCCNPARRRWDTCSALVPAQPPLRRAGGGTDGVRARAVAVHGLAAIRGALDDAPRVSEAGELRASVGAASQATSG